MTNNPLEYDDATIGAALVDEVPAPRTGYWEHIDASLRAIASETATGATHTEPPVIRLTDMNENTTAPFASRLVTRAAILIVIALGISGIAFATLRSNMDPIVTANVPTTTAAPTTATPTTTAPAQAIEIGSFTYAAVSDAGLEAIGCWFSLPDHEEEVTFFSGWDGGLMSISGELVLFKAVDGAQAIDMWTVDAYTSADYSIGLVVTGERIETSIESQSWPITLTVAANSGSVVVLDGTLNCGV